MLTVTHRFILATHQGLPTPQVDPPSSQDLAQVVQSYGRVRSTGQHGVLIDLWSPLVLPIVNPRGHSSHWAARTADVAVEKQFGHWLAMFDSQTAWDERMVTPGLLGSEGMIAEGYISKRGYNKTTMRRRQQRRWQESYERAVANMRFEFRDEGLHYEEHIMNAAPFVAEANDLMLQMLGMKSQEAVGPVSFHLLVLCGNERAFDHVLPGLMYGFMSFPLPPLVPPPYRQDLCQQLLAVLNRDLYFQLQGDTSVDVNARLDSALAGHLNFDYADVPTSFMRVERRDGFWFLHTRVTGEALYDPPQLEDLHAGIPPIDPAIQHARIASNLFQYATSGTFPLAALRLRLDFVKYTPSNTGLYFKRASTPDFTIEVPIVQDETLDLPSIDLSDSWDLWIFSSDPSLNASGVFTHGTWWAVDDHGNLSTAAVWATHGNFLYAEPWTKVWVRGQLAPDPFVVQEDLFRFAHAGPTPLVQMRIVCTAAILPNVVVQLGIRTSAESGIGRSLFPLNTEVLLPFPLAGGQVWNMVLGELDTLPVGTVFYAQGFFNVEDAAGARSADARWRLFYTRSAP